MSFADLEAGALRAPVGRKARGGPNDARGLVFQITTAVASYRRLLNSLGTPKDTPTLRDQLHKTSQNILQLAKDAKDKLQKAAEADKSIDTSADKRVADMKLAKDFGATMEEFRKLQNLAIQREMAYKPVVPQNAQSNYTTDDRSAESGKRCCNWIMRLFSMKLSSRKENKPFKRSNNRSVKYMKCSRILLHSYMPKEL
ncbi:hypothetical protein PVAP13_1KG466600 [Panicum virgatum]|uniref:Syntaxin N-terminal domain-containing protein n=1 Tax=Panicum virgatum TaxID=38727 RepID=A0A8T0XHH4_PANVG|nr:hypothetical protein PVAP13_1KG466600 [Panicum virgatum]